MVNWGTRQYRRFRDFFSKMERGRILLLGIIACVMLFGRVYSWVTTIWYIPEDYRISLFIDSSPGILAYSTGLVIVLYVVISVRGRMRENGETMTLEHLRELAFIALVLALLATPSTIVGIAAAVETIIDPNPWEPDIVINQRLFSSIGSVIGLSLYAMIASLSWKAYKIRSGETDHRLKRGRVLTLTLTGLMMQASNLIYMFGWLRYHQITQSEEDLSWASLMQSPFWFYFSCLLFCAFLGWFILIWYRMRLEDERMSHGQWQELAVISIGLALISVPIIVDEMWNYIETNILEDPIDRGEAIETVWLYARLGLLFTFFGQLIIGLLAMRRYRRTSPIDVVPLGEPALPPPTDAPENRPFHED